VKLGTKRGRRAGIALLVICLGLTALAIPVEGASHRPVAVASKKCKKKHHGHRTRCKKRPRAVLSISPAATDFGTIGPIDSAPYDFVVTNTGKLPSGTPATSVSGPGAAYFRINATSCSGPLAPAESCTVTVQSVNNDGGSGTAKLDVAAAPGGAVSAALIVNLY
jgi:hypothetical protein